MKIQSTFCKLSLWSLGIKDMSVKRHRPKLIFADSASLSFPYIEAASAVTEFHFRLPVNQKSKAKVKYGHQNSYDFSPGVINLFFISFGSK